MGMWSYTLYSVSIPCLFSTAVEYFMTYNPLHVNIGFKLIESQIIMQYSSLCSLVGFAPFWHRRQVTMIKSITEGKYKFGSPEWDDISEGPKDLVRDANMIVELCFTAFEIALNSKSVWLVFR